MREIIVLIGVLFSLNVYSQPKLNLGSEELHGKGEYLQEVLGVEDDQILITRLRTRGKGTSVLVERRNKETLTAIKSAEFREDEYEHCHHLGSFMKDGSIFILYSGQVDDGDTLKTSIYIKKINAGTLVQEKAFELRPNFAHQFDRVGFQVSPDKSKLLLYGQRLITIPRTILQTEHTGFHILSVPDLTEESMKYVPRSDRGFDLETANFSIDDEGNILFNALYFDPPKLAFGSTGSTRTIKNIAVGILLKEDDKPIFVDVSAPGGKYLRDKEIKLLSNGDLLICGLFADNYYADDTEETKQIGYFFQRVTPGSEEEPFYITQYYSTAIHEMISKHFEASLASLNITHLIELNEDVYLVAERYDQENAVKIGREIFITKLTSDNKVEWTVLIPRHTRAVHLDHTVANPGGYELLAKGDQIMLLFADHPDQVNTTESNYDLKKYKPIPQVGGNMICVTVKTDGTVTKKLLHSEKSLHYVPMNETIPIGDGEILINLRHKDQEQFGVIQY